MKRFAVALLVLLGGAASASATTVTYVISGTATSVTSGITSVQVGDAYIATLTVDLATPNTGSNPAFYYAFTSYTVAMGSYSGSFSTTNGRIRVEDDPSYDVFGVDDQFPTGTALDGLQPFVFQVAFLRNDVYPGSSDPVVGVALVLPTDPSQFNNQRNFSLQFLAPGGATTEGIHGIINALQVVPEPSLALLLPVAIATGAIAQRRQRS